MTVGSQLPFDRLTRAVDQWCAASGRSDVIGQIGEVGTDGYRPTHFRWSEFIPPAEFNRLLGQAELVIAHAGMGSIISALRNAKPIIIMARRANLGEHRNDHQLATAAHFANRQGVYVAQDEAALPVALEQGALSANQEVALSPWADGQFIDALRGYILGRNQ